MLHLTINLYKCIRPIRFPQIQSEKQASGKTPHQLPLLKFRVTEFNIIYGDSLIVNTRVRRQSNCCRDDNIMLSRLLHGPEHTFPWIHLRSYSKASCPHISPTLAKNSVKKFLKSFRFSGTSYAVHNVTKLHAKHILLTIIYLQVSQHILMQWCRQYLH